MRLLGALCLISVSASAQPTLLSVDSGLLDVDAGCEMVDAGALLDAGVEMVDGGADAGAVAEIPVPGDAGVTDGGPAVVTLKDKPLPKGFTGIVGRVIDGRSGEGLIEATIKVVAGGKKSALTDVDGYYRLRLPPGTYDLRVFYELYEGRRITNVVVSADRPVQTLDVALGRDARSVQEVVVEAKADKRNESALLQERKKAVAVSDAIGAQEMARTPDSNAGDAAKRVVSVTLVDNKYVFIRGLGGRYAQTLINGTVMPSPEPDEPSVPLDLFPTALLSNLTVVKTYTPDLPGTFGGGSLSIDTSTFPTQLEAKLRVQLGGDTQTTFQGRPGGPSSAGEAFGLRDPQRDLPAAVPRDKALSVTASSPEERQAAGRALPNVWTPQLLTALPNGSLAGQVGTTIKVGKESRLGLMFAAQWNRREHTRRTFVADISQNEGQQQLENPTNSDIGSVSAATSLLGQVGYQFNRDHEVSLLSLALVNAESQAILAQGTETLSSQQEQINNRLQFTQRQLFFNQLKGFHRFSSLAGIELEWQGNYSRVLRTEPDIRDTRYFLSEETRAPLLRFQPNSAERFFIDLTESSGGGGLSLALPFRSFRFRIGGMGQYSDRLFDGRRFRFSGRTSREGLAEEVLTADSIGPGPGTAYALGESTLTQDRYVSTLGVYAGYGLIEWKASDVLRASAGVRVEGSALTLTTGSPFTNMPAPPAIARNYLNALPSVNVTVSPSSTVNLRFAYAMTLARPTFRELGPFLFFDIVRRRQVSGNVDLLQTLIHHGDARAEWFPSENEVFAASLFGKYFIDPIERVVIGQGSNFDFGFRNAKASTLLGAEVEARSTLGRMTPALREVRVGANASFIYSRVQIDAASGQIGNADRPLQGQSPWVVNAFVTWARPEWGTEVGVSYNVYGPRISEVAVAGVPDFVEQPFHKLDLTLSQKLGRSFDLKVSAANLLNQAVRIRQGDIEVFRYPLGVQFNVALAWALGTERK